MTTVPTKIVLKSTTRMSLNDRFSTIAPSVQNIRANMAAEQQVSAANRRLAQQLANRPGLQGVSPEMMYTQQQKGGRQGNLNAAMKKRNLQQRLGKSNIKNRLSLPGGQPIRGRGRGRGRGGALPIQGGGGDNQWQANKMRGRGGFSPRMVRGRGSFRARGRGTFNRFTGQNTLKQRGGMRGGGGVRGAGGMRGAGGVRGARGGRGMKRGSRGQMRGRGGRGRGGNVSVQDLDNQLDEYMSKTKSHLDTELDSYMSEVTN